MIGLEVLSLLRSEFAQPFVTVANLCDAGGTGVAITVQVIT